LTLRDSKTRLDWIRPLAKRFIAQLLGQIIIEFSALLTA